MTHRHFKSADAPKKVNKQSKYHIAKIPFRKSEKKMASYSQIARSAGKYQIKMTYKIEQLDYKEGQKPKVPGHLDILSFMNQVVGVKPNSFKNCYFPRDKTPGTFWGKIELIENAPANEEKNKAAVAPNWINFGRTADGKAAYRAQMYQNNVRNGRKFRIHYPYRLGLTSYDKNSVIEQLKKQGHALKGRIMDENYQRNAPGGLARVGNGHWMFFLEETDNGIPESELPTEIKDIKVNGIELMIYFCESVEARVAKLVNEGADPDEARERIRNERVRNAAMRQIQKEKADFEKAEKEKADQAAAEAKAAANSAFDELNIDKYDVDKVLENAEQLAQLQKSNYETNRNNDFNDQVQAEVEKIKADYSKTIEAAKREAQLERKKLKAAKKDGGKKLSTGNTIIDDDATQLFGQVWDKDFAEKALDIIEGVITEDPEILDELKFDLKEVIATMYFTSNRTGELNRANILARITVLKRPLIITTIQKTIGLEKIKKGDIQHLIPIRSTFHRACTEFPRVNSILNEFLEVDSKGKLQWRKQMEIEDAG